VATGVASSWIDMLAGLSIMYWRKMPPGFWANAGAAIDIAISTPPAAAKVQSFSIISPFLPLLFALESSFPALSPDGKRFDHKHLFVEPEVFEPPAVVDTV